MIERSKETKDDRKERDGKLVGKKHRQIVRQNLKQKSEREKRDVTSGEYITLVN